jgi:hypothetical protein
VLAVFRRLRLVTFSVRARLGLIQILLLSLSIISLVAWYAISDERNSGQFLAMLSRAERHHLNTDVMLDALRSDVNAALRIKSEDSQAAGAVLANLHKDTRKFEAELEALEGLDLTPNFKRRFASNHPRTQAYSASSNRLVATAVRDHAQALTLEPSFNLAFEDFNTFSDGVDERSSRSGGARHAAGGVHCQVLDHRQRHRHRTSGVDLCRRDRRLDSPFTAASLRCCPGTGDVLGRAMSRGSRPVTKLGRSDLSD